MHLVLFIWHCQALYSNLLSWLSDYCPACNTLSADSLALWLLTLNFIFPLNLFACLWSVKNWTTTVFISGHHCYVWQIALPNKWMQQIQACSRIHSLRRDDTSECMSSLSRKWAHRSSSSQQTSPSSRSSKLPQPDLLLPLHSWPDKFVGDPTQCWGFLLQYTLLSRREFQVSLRLCSLSCSPARHTCSLPLYGNRAVSFPRLMTISLPRFAMFSTTSQRARRLINGGQTGKEASGWICLNMP